MEGLPIAVWRKSKSGADEMGDPIVTWASETVDNVLYGPTRSSSVSEAYRPEGTVDTMTAVFPKSYTQSLAGCELEAMGHRWKVIGDPEAYPKELTPGKWNRSVIARRVDG